MEQIQLMAENDIKNFICIRCPRGCEIKTTLDGNGGITEITGNVCKLGIEYAKEELTDPRRILTTTVRVAGGIRPLAPVWTEKPVPKDKIPLLAGLLRNVTVDAPVFAGRIIVENALNTGINIVASGSNPKK